MISIDCPDNNISFANGTISNITNDSIEPAKKTVISVINALFRIFLSTKRKR